MRLTKVPLVLVGDHVVNLNFLTNAYVEKYDTYPAKWRLRYFVDNTQPQEDEDGVGGQYVEFGSKKAAQAALIALSTASDTLVIEEAED